MNHTSLSRATTGVLIAALGACSEPMSSSAGVLVVSNTTSGAAFDPDGFEVRMATVAPASLDLNKALVLQGHPAGTYQVELADIAPNCRTDQGAVRNVSIEVGSATRLHFDVVCTPPRDLARVRVVFPRSANDLLPPRIVLMNADGSGSVELTGGAFWDQYPDVSPDARRIVFQSDRDNDPNGHPELHLMDVGGSAPTAVLTPGPAYMPDWSPDGRTIAVVSPGDYGAGQIQTLNLDSGGVQALTTMDTSLEHHRGDFRPAWSPDGRRVAFLRDRRAGAVTASIWIVNADGSGELRVTEPLLDVGMSPVWSPDGRRIAFSAYDGPLGAGSTRIYSINADGSGLVTVLEAQGEPFAVTDWSTDGAYLLLGRSNDLYLLRLTDETMMRLTVDGTYRNNQGARFWPGASGSTRQ